ENHKSLKDALLRFSSRLAGREGYVVIFLTVLMIALAGLWAAKQSGQDAELQMRRDLVRQAAGIAATANPADLRALSFTAEDKTKPEFQRLCAQLRAYAELTGINSLYTMALRNGQVVFGPENLPEKHPYASPPGTVYKRPAQKDFDIFETGSPQIQGPRGDEYGTFVTATAPVFDARTGEVLAVIGIDVEAAVWQASVRRAQWIPAGIALVLLFVLLLNWLTLKHRHHHSPRRSGRRRYAEPVLCTVFMSVLTLVLAVSFDQAERRSRKESFRELAQVHASACAQEFYDLRNRIDQLVDFFESSDDVSREEFSSYCKNLVQQGILHACIWMPAIPSAEAGSFVQTVRTAGLSGFSIWQKNAEGKREPAPLRPVYYPLLYIEPLSGRETAFGYDVNSEPVRSAAIQEVLRTGLATASDPAAFIVPTNLPAGLYIFEPVQARIQKGLAAFAVRAESLLGGAQRYSQKKNGLTICLFQLSSGTEPLFLAGSSGSCGLPCLDADESGLSITVPVFRFGKAYALRLIPDSSWLAAHPLRHGLIAATFGLLITILVSSLVTLITNRRINLEEQVDLRTAELEASRNMLIESQRIAHMGSYVLNIPAGLWESSPLLDEIFGIDERYKRTVDGWTALIHSDDRAVILDYFKNEVLGRRQPFNREYRVVRQNDQAVRWVQELGRLELDNHGNPLELHGTVQDITGRKQADEALARISRHNELILTSAAEGIMVLDLQGRHTFINPAAAKMLGCETEELIGSPSHSTWHHTRPDGTPFPEEECEIYATLHDGKVHSTSGDVFWRKDGTSFPVEYASTPICEQNRLTGAVVTFADITERKRADEALRESEERYRAVVKNMTELICRFEADDTIKFANEAYCCFFGKTSEKLIGGKWHPVVVPEDIPVIEKRLRMLSPDDPVVTIENRVCSGCGEVRWMQFVNHAFFDKSGRLIETQSVGRDITGRKQAEEELKQKYDELERFNKVTAGREVRMIELKKEINALLKAAGLPEKYRIVEGDK
ncbi:MAG: PAS domain S-box protein, partial [Kiritimatiellales bacterium]